MFGDTGIVLDNLRIISGATGGLTTSTFPAPSGFVTYNYNGITLSSGGDIVLQNNASVQAPYADVLFSLWGPEASLYIGKTGDLYRSYVIAKPTTTYVDFLARSSGGIYIDEVASTITVAGGSGFYAGDGSTPATEGAGLSVKYSGSGSNTVTNEVVKEINDLTDPIIDPPIIVGGCAGTQAGCTPPPAEDQGGGEGEFGEGENKGKGKKKAAQCKG